MEELQSMIRSRYPSATFALRQAPDDPASMHLLASVDAENPDEVLDLVLDRVLELQVDAGVPLHVVPVRSPERALAEMRGRSSTPSSIRERVQFAPLTVAARESASGARE